MIAGDASPALLDSYSHERVGAARENIAYGAKSTEFMAPPHAGFRLMREAALRLALDDEAVRSLINPRQTTPVAYHGSPLNVGDGALVGLPAPDARLADGSHLSRRFGARFALLRFAAATEKIDGVDAIDVSEADRDAWARYDARPGGVVLVRPDGYVAAQWTHADDAAIRAALARIMAAEEPVDAG